MAPSLRTVKVFWTQAPQVTPRMFTRVRISTAPIAIGCVADSGRPRSATR